MLNDASARHRLLLSLRSEAALGLRSVKRGSSARDFSDSVVVNNDIRRSDAAASVMLADSALIRSHIAPISDVALSAVASASADVELFARETAGVKFSDQPNVATLPLLKIAEKISTLSLLNENHVSGCTKCRLSQTRTQTVFGEGDANASIFFVGEGPGEDEDKTGRPFVGRSGKLLDKMIIAMGLAREQVFIANIVKCRPPGNRVPAPDEVETCTPYLVKQLEVIRPKAIVTLGLPAVKYMLSEPRITMGSVRGKWHAWRGIKLMPTYHPSYVLRNYTDATRAAVWSDLQQVMNEVGLTATKK